jgi:SAM-dependent methyltransferase
MKGPAERDDDTHYFDSYAGHDIHQIMISDTSRTYSYAKFIMSPQNAHLFRGKRIMDIGCGSGILSMFAARAGAKEVIAIDASDVAHRAEANIRENKLDHIVKVVKGKLENLKEELGLYEGKIDVIISEWMVGGLHLVSKGSWLTVSHSGLLLTLRVYVAIRLTCPRSIPPKGDFSRDSSSRAACSFALPHDPCSSV